MDDGILFLFFICMCCIIILIININILYRKIKNLESNEKQLKEEWFKGYKAGQTEPVCPRCDKLNK